VDYSIDNRDVAGKLVAAVDEARIAKTIVELSSFENRYYRTQGGVDAARWVHDRWHGLAQARDDVSVELFEHDAYPQPSVILTIEGSEQSDEVVVIGGHVDSIVQADANASTQAPGADENPSGIATATEVLRVAMARSHRHLSGPGRELGL
jgi:leucyl aminopeptidase